MSLPDMRTRAAPGNRWLPGWTSPRDGDVLVLCFPFAGGSAAAFRDWSRAAALALRFQPVELPGRATRFGEPPLRDMGGLVAAFLDDCAPILASHRYALFGHSLGAAVCTRLSAELEARRMPLPERLFLSGAAPSAKPSDPWHELPDRELARKLRTLDGTPAEVLDNPQLMEIVLPVIRADFALLSSRAPPRPLPCPVTAFSGTDDRLAAPHAVDRWGGLAPLGFRHVALPGGHFFLHAQGWRLRQEIAADLAA